MQLIVSPHVDDETLGCGGTLDDSCFILHLGLSENQRHGSKIFTREERLEEFEEVARKTNIAGYKLLDHPVNNYEQQKLIVDFENTINELKPTSIYMPHPSYNQDHRAAYEACLIALRPHDINYFVPRVLVYEQPQVFLWNHNYRPFNPTFFRAIDIDRKIELYKCLKSQVRDFRSPACIRAMAKLRGSQSNLEYAEAFEVLRSVAI